MPDRSAADRIESADVVVIGAGIVGLATARALISRAPDLRVVVLEKESAVGSHQTGHNSGVLHSGVYYRPGSLKAKLCIAGVRLMRQFCEQQGVPYRLCGKVIVASESHQLGALDELERRGQANGVPGLRRIGPGELKEIEPQAYGVAALHSPETGIVNYGDVARAMAKDFTERGGVVLLGEKVKAVRKAPILVVQTSSREIATRLLVNCAGLHADQVARLAGAQSSVRIVPFRGEYFSLQPGLAELVRGLIYPIPDSRLPFLGVHFTPRISGGVECGPNAVLATAREGYAWSNWSIGDLSGTLSYPGFWRVVRRYWRVGAFELYRSLSRASFARSLSELMPGVTASDLIPAGAGVRAQAVARDGTLIDDFVVEQSAHAVHVLNAPSPAATASLAIGDKVAELVLSKLPTVRVRSKKDEMEAKV